MSKVAVSVMGGVVLVAVADGGGGFGGDGDGGASTGGVGQGSDDGLDVGEVAGVGEVAEVGEVADVGGVYVEKAAEVGEVAEVSKVEAKVACYRSLVKVRCVKCEVTFQGPSLALGQLQATISYHRAQLNSVKSQSLEEPTEGPRSAGLCAEVFAEESPGSCMRVMGELGGAVARVPAGLMETAAGTLAGACRLCTAS
jgi:hypothetical protein